MYWIESAAEYAESHTDPWDVFLQFFMIFTRNDIVSSGSILAVPDYVAQPFF
jgi:hypothetical protein